MARGAAWTVEKVGHALDGSATVDFTSTKFLQQYAIVFAASTVLTLVLWLIAVAKRAMRGVPLPTAFGEAVGFLWLTVIASAFTPLTLQVVVSAVDSVTNAVTGSDGSMPALFKTLAEVLRRDGDIVGGGPIMLIIVSGVTIIAAGILGLELVLRAAALYLGALLGVVVYTALVDRDLWGKVRMWAGIMVAVILLKPIIEIALGIADVFTQGQGSDPGTVLVAGNAVVIIAIGAGVAIFRFVPGYGDDIKAGLAVRAGATAARGALKVTGTAAGVVAQGIQTHAGRGDNSRRSGGQGGGGRNSRVNGVADGMSTHSNRGTGKQKKSGDK
ncbi:hypothetical protein RI578_40415 (plasmid) [Streptomyces sp. BB1-1-1]|uniref:hypothetical protein n=1 Tax=Streptomyces sp. BB1-1-1 TaxID=3074430 RepID=UPI002877EFE2|nr:hypothetical protein [Streptomyces sp. BB1-1-1]WND40558.1 hypothetical protein RI578_40415 [Streptomyces sp. BB1-1-1]